MDRQDLFMTINLAQLNVLNAKLLHNFKYISGASEKGFFITSSCDGPLLYFS